MKKYYLGLIISKDTIGWAISSSDNRIEDFGVQVWDLPNTNFGNKKLHFKKLRKKLLKEILNKKVFLNTPNTIPKDIIISEWIKDLQKNSNVNQLKNDAIFCNKKLNNQELAWVLLSYINKRGRNVISETIVDDLTKHCESVITDLKNKKNKKAYSTKRIKRINESLSFYESKKQELEAMNSTFIYPCTFALSNDSIVTKNTIKKRNRIFTRFHHEMECKKILEKQGLDEKAIQLLVDVIFYEDLTKNPLLTVFFKKNLQKQLRRVIKKRNRLKKIKEKTIQDREEIKSLTKKIFKLNSKSKYRNQNCYYYKDEKLAPNNTVFRSLYYFCKNSESIDAQFKNNSDLVKAFFQYKKKQIIEKIGGLWRILNDTIQIKTDKKTIRPKRIDCFNSNSYLNSNTLKELKDNDLPLKDFLDLVKKFDENVAIHFSIDNPKYQYMKIKQYLKKNVIMNYKVYKESFFIPMHFIEIFFSLKLMYDAVLNSITNNERINDFLIQKWIVKDVIPRNSLPNSLEDTFTISKLMNKGRKNPTMFRILTNTRQLIKSIYEYYRKKLNILNTQKLFERINISFDDSIGSFQENPKAFSFIFLSQHHNQKEEQFDTEQFLENERKKDFINAIIYHNNLENSKNTRMLVKLYLEQGGEVDNSNYKEISKATCLLTKGRNNISLMDIKNKQVDNGHILSATYGVDIIENRFIVRKIANRNQMSLLPYKFICQDHKDLEDEYVSKIKDFYDKKSIKRKLFLIKSLNNGQKKELKNLKDSFYQWRIGKVFKNIMYKWLLIELIKRDYILLKGKLWIKGKKYKNKEYLSWWKDKHKEMEKRISWFPQYKLSIVKKNLLSESMLNSSSLNLKTWLISNENTLRRLTKWSYAIDAIALSWIQYYGVKFPGYLWELKKTTNNVMGKSLEKNEETISITHDITIKNKSIVNKDKKTLLEAKKPFENIDEVINKKIPIKLASTNDIVFSFILLELKRNRNIHQTSKSFLFGFKKMNSFIQSCLNYISQTPSTKELLFKRKKEYRWSKDLSYTILAMLNEENKEELSEFLTNLSLLLKELRTIWIERMTPIYEKRYFEFTMLFNTSMMWKAYQDLKDAPSNIIKTMQDSKIFLKICEKHKNLNEPLVFINDIDSDPKKVIKKIYDGKLKYKKKCVIDRLKIGSLKAYISHGRSNKETQKIIEMIKVYRKDFSTQLKRKINEKILKNNILLDNNGHLCILDLIGLVYNKKTNETIKQMTYLEFVDFCSNVIFFTDQNNELFFFNREAFFSLSVRKKMKKPYKVFNYPLTLTCHTKLCKTKKRTKIKRILKFHSNDFPFNHAFINYKIDANLTHSRRILFNSDLIKTQE